MIKGIGASPGIALAKSLIVKNEEIIINKRNVDDINFEINKFKEAILSSKKDLTAMKEKVLREIGESEAEIFEMHIMLLEDDCFNSEVTDMIVNERCNAEFALDKVAQGHIALFESMDNDYMKERAADIKDISQRTIRHILNVKTVDLSNLMEDVILIAEDLTPSDTASMDKSRVKGFITKIGGRTSHTAIMARTLEIPAIVGCGEALEKVKDGDFIAMNGEAGSLEINPSELLIRTFNVLKKEEEEHKAVLKEFKGKKTVSLDGRHVELAGNIGSPNDIEALLSNDAEGVGLYRTEFLYMNKETSFPTEEEQFDAYKQVLEAMNGKPVIIRTLDIGGDKNLPYFQIESEMNPFLGYRAIRLCLDRKDIFKTQLRALYRASIYGKLRIMFPMISSLEELLKVKEICEEVKSELREENISFSEDIEIGMMIEVPSAALMSDILAKHVDFFSIGTNDLIQYTCAVDRMNEKVSHLYNQLNLGVLRLIKIVIDNAHKEGKWVGMCGEAAGDMEMIEFLLGMGLDEFSMSPSSILKARKLISETSYEKANEMASKLLKDGCL